MKNVYKYLFCILAFLACEDDNNLLEDIAFRGGFVQFQEKPELNINILELDTAIISEQLIDPNNNASSYSLDLLHDGNVVKDFVTLNSFPSKLEIPISSMISALGLTNDDIVLSTKFSLVATITTPTGIFSGLSPKFDNNNINQGGNSTVRLKANNFRDAIEFDVTFFLPPAKTIRKTSFEAVAIGPTNTPYTRNGDKDETGDLVNGSAPPFVDFIANGTSDKDEIGFNSEYIAVPNISSSSLGFDKERIGVYSLFEDYDAYPDGVKGYHLEDIDGMIRITFDVVNVPIGQEKSGISFQAYFNDTSWEAKDGMFAYVNITTDSGSDVIEMIKVFDDEVEAISGSWKEFNTGFLTGIRSYQLVIEASGGATPESIDIDNIVVYEPKNETIN